MGIHERALSPFLRVLSHASQISLALATGSRANFRNPDAKVFDFFFAIATMSSNCPSVCVSNTMESLLCMRIAITSVELIEARTEK